MRWEKMPSKAGWYFFVRNLAHWRNACPVGVKGVEFPDGSVAIQQLVTDEFKDDAVREFDGYWYGPIYPVDPDEPKPVTTRSVR